MADLDPRKIDTEELESASFPEVRHGFRVWIEPEAFAALRDHGKEHDDREVGGVLVGRVHRDERSDPWIRIDAVISALHAEEREAELTFTHETWDAIHRELESHGEEARIVGWYHTHPGFGIFLSDRDSFIQTSFFDLPFQVALVYDPLSDEHGLFEWRDGEIRRRRRWWVGEEAHRFDGPDGPQRAEEEEREMTPSRPRDEGHGPPSRPAPAELDLTTLILGGAILLVLGVLGGWALTRVAMGGALRQAEQRMARERAEGARDLAQGINQNLADVLADVVSERGLRRNLDQALAAVDAALGAAEGAGASEAELEALREARRRLRDLREKQAMASLELRALRSLGAAPDPMETAQQVAGQQAALRHLYLELADSLAASGQKPRAARLLQGAAKLDPQGRAQYEAGLRRLESMP